MSHTIILYLILAASTFLSAHRTGDPVWPVSCGSVLNQAGTRYRHTVVHSVLPSKCLVSGFTYYSLLSIRLGDSN